MPVTPDGRLFRSFPANFRRSGFMPTKLYVGNLAYAVTQEDLADLFAQAGKVESAVGVADKSAGKSRGFGFVEMADAADATKAIETLNDTDLKGRRIKIDEARASTGGPRGGGGGGGDRRRGGGGGGGREGGGGGGNRDRWQHRARAKIAEIKNGAAGVNSSRRAALFLGHAFSSARVSPTPARFCYRYAPKWLRPIPSAKLRMKSDRMRKRTLLIAAAAVALAPPPAAPPKASRADQAGTVPTGTLRNVAGIVVHSGGRVVQVGTAFFVAVPSTVFPGRSLSDVVTAHHNLVDDGGKPREGPPL